jgi:hypothetical protein
MRYLIIPIFVFSFFLMHCDSTTEPQPPKCDPISDPSKQIEIVYPTANEILKIGETINIQWKARPGLGSVGLSLEIGPERKNIFDKSILVPDGQDAVCMDTAWIAGKVIDKNNPMIDQDIDAFLVVYNYNSPRENDRVLVKLRK